MKGRMYKRWSVETYFSRLKKILGEKVRGRSFEDVVRYVLGMLILLSQPTNKILVFLVFKDNLRIYSQTHYRRIKRQGFKILGP